MVNLFQISRANESQKKSHFGVKFWPVQAASQTDAVSILLNIKWPDPSVWPWHRVVWPDFSLWTIPPCQTDPKCCVAFGPGSLLCCKWCPLGPKIYLYFCAAFWSTKALEWSKGGVATHKRGCFYGLKLQGCVTSPRVWVGLCRRMGQPWETAGVWSAPKCLVTAPGKRMGQSQGAKQEFSMWAGKGLGTELTTRPF